MLNKAMYIGLGHVWCGRGDSSGMGIAVGGDVGVWVTLGSVAWGWCRALGAIGHLWDRGLGPWATRSAWVGALGH